jgi:hypothetical protein
MKPINPATLYRIMVRAEAAISSGAGSYSEMVEGSSPAVPPAPAETQGEKLPKTERIPVVRECIPTLIIPVQADYGVVVDYSPAQTDSVVVDTGPAEDEYDPNRLEEKVKQVKKSRGGEFVPYEAHSPSKDVQIRFNGGVSVISEREARACAAMRKYKPRIMIAKKHIIGVGLNEKGLSQIPDDLNQLDYLVALDVSHNLIGNIGIMPLIELGGLYAGNNRFESLFGIGAMRNLAYADFGNNPELTDVRELQELRKLEYADLQNTKIDWLKPFVELPNIKQIVVYNTPIDWNDALVKQQRAQLEARGVDIVDDDAFKRDPYIDFKKLKRKPEESELE